MVKEDAVSLVSTLRNAHRDERGRLVDQADWHLTRSYVLRAIGSLDRLNDQETRRWRTMALTLMNTPLTHAQSQDHASDTRSVAYRLLREYFPEFARHTYVVNSDALMAHWGQFPFRESVQVGTE